jgi:hypothetical protein
VERGKVLGEWLVIEYATASGRKIKSWSFPNFNEAEVFRSERMEFYRTVGLDKKRHLTPALPRISDGEMELFERIIENPEWMRRIRHQFVR